MKHDSRSPEQNRSLYPPPAPTPSHQPPPHPPYIESRVCIHTATLRKKIDFKFDNFLRLFTDMTLLKFSFSTMHVGGFYLLYMVLMRRGWGGGGYERLEVTTLKFYIFYKSY
jgi:hypothetical protein